MYSIEDLTNELNLEPAFIRKCKSELWEIFKNEVKKGEKNKDLFTSNAFVIFQQIAKYKDKGYTINKIKKQIENEIKTEQKSIKTVEKNIKTEEDNILLKSFLELQNKYIKDQEEKNNHILELSEALTTLRSELKLLPEGKTPAEIKTEWEQEQIKRLEQEQQQQMKQFKKEQLIDELYKVSVFNFWKKRKIYEQIKNL